MGTGKRIDRRQQIIDLLYEEPYKIGHWLKFTKLIQLHNNWIRLFLFSVNDITLLAHRNSFKTTCVSLAIALLMIIFPNKTILFVRKTDTDVWEVIAQVKKFLKSPLFARLIKILWGASLEFVRDTVNEIDTNLKTTNKGTSQLP